MEDTLGECAIQDLFVADNKVLILVLMEDTLGEVLNAVSFDESLMS